jgi:colicin import membrane protein
MASTSATLPREPALTPRTEDGLGVGAVMALLVHAGLILALALGVNWRASEPEGVTAELWASVPQIAAPKAEPPPPQPEPVKPAPKPVEPPKPSPAELQQQRDAEIAIEKDRERKLKQQQEQQARDKAEREKAERDKQAKAEADKQAKGEADARRKQQQQEEARLAKQREENLKRMMGEAGGTGAPTATGKAARDAGPSATYAGRIKARIKPNIVFTDEVSGNPEAEAELRVAPDGTILSRRIVKSSGVKEWDDAVLRAIDRTEVLPRDTDGRVPSSMLISFRPKD